MIRLLAYIAAGIASVLLVATIFGERLVEYDDQVAVLLFGAVLGFLTHFIKPVVSAISFPITCLTFGLFALVINAGFFALAAWIAPGVEATWIGAAVGGLTASVLGGIIYTVFDEETKPDRGGS